MGAARSAAAQALRGAVRDSAGGTPIPGAVVSVIDAAGTSLARTLADGAGRFSIAIPANGANLRVLRIGYRPRDLAIPSDRTAVLQIAMEKVPPLLEAVKVSDHELCPGSADRGAAFQLWDQARAGLLAAVVARESNPADAIMLNFEQRLSPSDEHVDHLTVQMKTGHTTRPFTAAASPGFFAQHGYMLEDGSGTRVFDAPDADVLLDPSFAATHCFRRHGADKEHAGQTGVSFTPVDAEGRDTLVDVTGVIWIDDKAPQVRSLDFLYTSLEPVAMDAKAGGHVEFRTMPNGVSFIERWYLRLPELAPVLGPRETLPGTTAQRPGTRGERRNLRVAQINKSGGVVIDASWQDGTKWHDPPTGVKGIVTDKTGRRVRAAVISIAGSNSSVAADSTGAFTFVPIAPGKYTFVAGDTLLSAFVAERDEKRDLEVVQGQVRDLDVTVQPVTDAIAKLCRDQPANGKTSVIAGHVEVAGGNPPDLRIRSNWLADVNLQALQTAIKNGAQLATVDDNGRFVVCAVARGRPVTLEAMSAGQIVADTTVRVGEDNEVLTFDWKTAKRAANVATLAGTVVSGASHAPVAGAQVSIVGTNRSATTGADGWFQLDDLPAGSYAVQVRHAGDAQMIDSVRLRPGDKVQRTYTLEHAVGLDTLRARYGSIE